MAASKDWDRLAEFVRERRVDLGMTQEDARAAGGPSTATMRLIEGALQHGYHPATLRDLEKALRWERGSAARILAGGEPAPLETDSRRAVAAEAMSEAGRHEVTAPASSRVAFPLPAPSEAMARQLAPFLAEVEVRVRVAQGAHPGQRLTGEWVYPDLPEGAAYWDALADAGFAPEHIPGSVATMLAMSADRAEAARRRDGHAAGLIRYRAIRHIGSATAMTRA